MTEYLANTDILSEITGDLRKMGRPYAADEVARAIIELSAWRLLGWPPTLTVPEKQILDYISGEHKRAEIVDAQAILASGPPNA